MRTRAAARRPSLVGQQADASCTRRVAGLSFLYGVTTAKFVARRLRQQVRHRVRAPVASVSAAAVAAAAVIFAILEAWRLSVVLSASERSAGRAMHEQSARGRSVREQSDRGLSDFEQSEHR